MPKKKRGVTSRMSSLVNIPQDVVVENILEKLPVKSLLRLKAVSKQWKLEIESQRFQERHLRYQEKYRDPSILVNDLGLDEYGRATLRTLRLGETSVSTETNITTHHYPGYGHLNKWSSYLRITQSCDGLVCLYSKSVVYVINPATRWYRKLPNSRYQQQHLSRFRDASSLGFGKDNITGIYKLVWLYKTHWLDDLDGQTYTYEVFSFDNNNNSTWRHDVIVTCPYPILYTKAPTHAHGSLHWFIDAVTETQILSFNLHTETFTIMAKLPVDSASSHDLINMCNLNNSLCLSEDNGDTQTIWSLNQDNMTWLKTYTIRSSLSCPIASLLNKRLLLYDFCDDSYKLVVHNSRYNSYGTFFTTPYCLKTAISYYQSLITIP